MLETTQRTEEPELRDAMDRYATGDSAAFELLYDRMAPRLRAMLRRRCDPALAEDIIQQTFLRIHCARAHYRRGHDVAPWAYAIARRLLIDAWRRQRREDQRPPEHSGENALPGPEDDLIAGETALRLERELDALPPLHREAFSLVKLEGYSLDHTAELLGTSVNAIKLRVHRAYRSLRSAVQGSK